MNDSAGPPPQRSVTVMEVSPRDGLQNESVRLTTEQKLTLVQYALDASLGGIGGCPFAPQAAGNIATEDLVYMLDRTHIRHDARLDALLEGAAWLQEALGKTLPSAVLKAGGFPSGGAAEVA